MVSSYIVIPLTLTYLDSTRYGIWLTLLSIIGWFNLMDIGIGNGLRNKLAQALANDDKMLARHYVSTAYYLFGLLITFFSLIFFLVSNNINWASALNAPVGMRNELLKLINIVYLFFALRFIFQLIQSISFAVQKSFLPDMINAVINVLSLIAVMLLMKFSQSSLLLLGSWVSMIPVIVLMLFSFVIFLRFYPFLIPSIKYIKFSYVRDLVSVGMKFFIIQISAVILYMSQNFIIIRMLGPAEVTNYNIVYRYFSIILILNSIIISPFWSSFTDAYYQEDFEWIKKSLSKLKKYGFLLSLIILLLIAFSTFFYKFWLRQDLPIPFSATFFMGMYQ